MAALRSSFRLQPVLNVKELREDQLQADLALRRREEEQQRQRLAALEQARHQQLADLARLSAPGPLDLAQLGAADHYLTTIDDDLIHQSLATAEAAEATATTRGALATAMQERKILEQLRDHQRQALQRHIRQLEMNQADDTAISRYARRQAEESA